MIVKKFIRMVCANFSHWNGGVIGYAEAVISTDKRNKEQRPISGLWILRRCAMCNEIYSGHSASDLVGGRKSPVKNGDYVIFVEMCLVGCNPKELFFDANEKTTTIGCNFCRRSVEKKSFTDALTSWESLNRKA